MSNNKYNKVIVNYVDQYFWQVIWIHTLSTTTFAYFAYLNRILSLLNFCYCEKIRILLQFLSTQRLSSSNKYFHCFLNIYLARPGLKKHSLGIEPLWLNINDVTVFRYGVHNFVTLVFWPKFNIKDLKVLEMVS